MGTVQVDGGTEAAKKVATHLRFFGYRIWGVRSDIWKLWGKWKGCALERTGIQKGKEVVG